ncbi:hypothetical protein DPEC_G00175970 [Dallia pectoralis]|uniref:Uncharacterized protein n=1 Tax=Dallia pectoralis TaxID=75939 RepID=A0ACC2GEB6_DALPE|nr:hypothetical protein DPEC_G00175970 [Dallia pectoralis]
MTQDWSVRRSMGPFCSFTSGSLHYLTLSSNLTIPVTLYSSPCIPRSSQYPVVVEALSIPLHTSPLFSQHPLVPRTLLLCHSPELPGHQALW